MDNSLFTSLSSTLGEQLPKVFGAIAILVLGWFLAIAARAALTKILKLVGLNEKINHGGDTELDLEKIISLGAFGLILLITALAVFDALGLDIVSTPLNTLTTEIFEYMPQLAGGLVLLLVAWLVATGAKLIVSKSLAATTLDEKIAAEAGMVPMSESLSKALYWFVMLLFLPAVLGALQLGGLLDPVQAMVDKILLMLPNIVAAIVIGVVGWFVAKILRDLVSNLLAATGADKLGQQAGLKGEVSVSKLVGTVIFIFVFIPALIASLNALQIESISKPATDMLALIMNAIPNLFAATAIIMVTYYVAKLAANLVKNLLEGMGFNSLPEKIGITAAFDDESKASDLVGKLIVFFAMLFASVEASNRLGFDQVRDIVSTFIQFGGQILLGSIVLAVGYWLANLAYNGIKRVSGDEANAMAALARIAILTLVAAMGLRSMGIADDIVNMAFGLTLGAVAVAIALSFGLGGREAAGKQMEYWLSKLQK